MTEVETKSNIDILDITVDIVSAFVSNNHVQAADIPGLISNVHAALDKLANGQGNAPQEPAPVAAPAVPVKKSVTDDYIVCLEDGKKFKSLKRHLRTAFDMTPAEYRAKWGLSNDYPMVAPNYARARSSLAKEMGLGSMRRRSAAAAPAKTAPASDEAPKRRGRPKKAA